MSLNIDMKIIRSLKFSGLMFFPCRYAWILWRISNALALGKIFHSKSIGSPSNPCNSLKVHQRRKQKHVVSSRDTAYLWDKNLVDLGRKKGQSPRVWHRKFWRPLRNATLGKLRVHATSRSKYERPTRTRCKHFGNIDGLREDAHFDMDAMYGCIDAGGIARGPELRELWILRTSRICSVLREWWSKEIQKLRKYYPQMLRTPCGKKSVFA